MKVWWISADCYGSLVDFNRVLLRFSGLQTIVMAFWWNSTGCYGSLLDFSRVL
jgi:hypothetical protein